VVTAALAVDTARAQLDLALAAVSQTAAAEVPAESTQAHEAPAKATPAATDDAAPTPHSAVLQPSAQEARAAGVGAEQRKGAAPVAGTGKAQAAPEPEAVSQLKTRLNEANNTLAIKKADADLADKLATSACEKAGKAEPALAASQAAHDAAEKLENAGASATHAEMDAARSNAEVAKARQQFEQSLNDLRSPSHVLAAGLKRHLPPSYAPEIDECARNPSEVELCVANAVARINDSSVPLVPCPTVGTGHIQAPTLLDDGAAVALPSSDRRDHNLCAKLPLDALLALRASPQTPTDEVDNGNDGSFDAQLLLTADGAVLHGLSDDDSPLRVAQFPDFKPEHSRASRVIESVVIGPDTYHAFLQPVRIALAATPGEGNANAATFGERNDVLVAGLVKDSRLKSAATQISLPSYLWFVLLLAFGLLCLPLAKLWFLGTRSSFARFDVTLLGASAVLITLLAIVLALGFVAHNRLAQRLDNQLGDVSTQLSTRVSNLVKERAKRLDQFLKSEQLACGPGQITPNLFPGDQRPRDVCEHVKVGGQLAEGARVFLTDEGGRQTVKYTHAEHTTTPISIAFRDYFQRAARGEPVCLGTQGCTLKSVPEVVRSATSGKFVLVVAKDISSQNSADATVQGRSRIAVLEDELRLTDLVLPLGFQSAVIRDDGTVMLHSDSDARFGQHLFDDVDDADGLRAAIAARKGEPFGIRYLGVPSRLTLRPLSLDGARWFAISIAPTALTDLAAVNMGLTTLAGYGALLLLIVTLAFLLVLATETGPWLVGYRRHKTGTDDSRLGPSLRPNSGYSAQYGSVGLFATRATLVVGAGSLFFFSCSTVWLLLTVFFAALALLWLPGLGINGPLAETHDSLVRCWTAARKKLKLVDKPTADCAGATPCQLSTSYPLALTGLVGIIVAAPTIALFGGAYDYYADCMVRAEQHHYVQTLRLLPQCLNEKDTDPECEKVIQAGQPSHALESKGSPSDDLVSQLLNPLPWFASTMPHLGPSVATALAQASITDAVGVVFSFARHPHSLSVKNPQGKELFATEVPTLLSTEYNCGHLLWAGILFATFLGLGRVASTCSLRRLFFLKLLSEQREPSTANACWLLDAKGRSERRLVLLLHPTPNLREELERAASVVNFAQLSTAQLAAKEDGQLWLLPDLEAHLEDATMAARIAAAAVHAKRLVLFSEVDPLRRSKPELLEAWADALRCFREEELAVVMSSTEQRPSTAMMTAWWRDSDDDERRVLWQLAVEGYTNPHPANFPALKHLVGRGLLRADKLTIENAAFADYISHATSADDARRWQDAGEDTTWQSIRVPLTTAVAALLTALAASKPELGIASALVPLATVGLPSLLRILSATLLK